MSWSARNWSNDGTNFVFEGDSLTADNHNGRNPYPTQLQNLPTYKNKGAFVNSGLSGDTIQNILTTYTAQIHPYAPGLLRIPAKLYIWAGTNDLGTRTAAQVYADLSSFWALAKADGFKVIAFTISKRASPNALTGPQETARQAVNTSIKGDLTKFDYLADVDSWFPDASDLTYYYDGLHNTDAGTLLIAQNAAALFTP